MFTVGLALLPPETMPGPVQLYELIPAGPPDKTTFVVVHVNVPPVDAVATGALPDELIDIVEVAAPGHAPPEPVTTTV